MIGGFLFGFVLPAVVIISAILLEIRAERRHNRDIDRIQNRTNDGTNR